MGGMPSSHSPFSSYFDWRSLKSEYMFYGMFLDGSGKLTNPKSDFVVLAGIILQGGSEAGNKGWHGILRQHAERNKLPNPRYFHATEALRTIERFSMWSKASAHALATSRCFLRVASLSGGGCARQ